MPLPPSPFNVLPKLAKPLWRGIDFPPHDGADASGGHVQAELTYPYIPGAAHDNVRRAPMRYPFKLKFLNSLRDNMFPALYNDWEQEFIFNGTIGELQHPLFGRVDVRPLEWSVDANVDRTSGVLMDVVFVESIRDVEDLPHFNLAAPVLADIASTIDSDMKVMGIPYPTGERTTSFLDLIRMIQGLIFSTRLTIEGQINQALGVIDAVVDLVESVPAAIHGVTNTAKHFFWSLLFKLKELRNSVKDVGKQIGINASRPIAKRRTQSKTTVTEISSQTGNTVNDLIVLNPGILAAPSVAKNKLISYYA